MGYYIKVRSEITPWDSYRNVFILKKSPSLDQVSKLEEDFQREFPDFSSKYYTFMWDDVTVDQRQFDPFENIGYRVMHFTLLRANVVGSMRRKFKVVSLKSDEDLERVLDFECSSISASQGKPCSERRQHRRMAVLRTYWRLVANGDNRWWGVFDGGQLVSHLGIFGDDSMARFQRVETHPNYRRRGIARALILHAISDWNMRYPKADVYIKAERHSKAEKLYREIGFVAEEYTSDIRRVNQVSL